MRMLIASTAAAALFALAAAGTASARPADGNWTGVYVGAAAGVQFSRTHFALPGDMADVLQQDHANQDSFAWSGLIGFNKQFGSTVVGLEGDLGEANDKRGVDSCNVTDGCWTSAHDSFTTHHTLKEGLTGRLRVRAGVAMGPTLFYAAGGYSAAKTRLDLVGDCYNFGNPSTPLVFNFSREKTVSGFNLGAGVEQAVGPVVLRAEAIYDDFGNQTYKGDGSEWNDRRITLHNTTVRAAVSYAF